jgi:hypothetical protein
MSPKAGKALRLKRIAPPVPGSIPGLRCPRREKGSVLVLISKSYWSWRVGGGIHLRLLGLVTWAQPVCHTVLMASRDKSQWR